MSAKETTPLLGYGSGSSPRPNTPPTPERSVFEEGEHSEQLQLPHVQELMSGSKGGISFFTSVCYIVGLFGIVPVVAMPGAIVYCGWLGFVIAIVLLGVSAYTAILLSRCWLMMEVFWPQDASAGRRHPYPALAEKAGGPRLRKVVTFMQNAALFGACVPFMLLGSETLQELVARASGFKADVSFCYWLLIMTFVLTPFLIGMGTPKDFGPVTWIAAGSVVLCSILTVISLGQAAPSMPRAPPANPTLTSVAYCFGAIAFQFDIHPMILTVQMDMKQKSRLPQALLLAFAIGLTMFITISFVAFHWYGENIKANLLNNLTRGPVFYINMGLITIQLLMCVVLGINTLFQDLESMFNIPDVLCWKRVFLRIWVMVVILFIAESIPHFGVAMELVGGLLVTPFMFMFPPVFYVMLKYKATTRLDVRDLVIGLNIMILGILGALASTTESIIQLTELTKFAPPCYIDIKGATQAAQESFENNIVIPQIPQFFGSNTIDSTGT